jgi:hypothetical protein
MLFLLQKLGWTASAGVMLLALPVLVAPGFGQGMGGGAKAVPRKSPMLRLDKPVPKIQ